MCCTSTRPTGSKWAPRLPRPRARGRKPTDAGDPIRKILDVARAGHFDLIVMGTHGRVGRLHALVGSVAEAVVRSSSCPVLTVRRPDGENESFSERIHGRQSIGDIERQR
jgi:hypothetical protein